MKIGDEVVCVDNTGLRMCKKPLLNEIYTIRAFNADGGILLKELINVWHNQLNEELGYWPYRFREIHYNSSAISELLEERKVEKG